MEIEMKDLFVVVDIGEKAIKSCMCDKSTIGSYRAKIIDVNLTKGVPMDRINVQIMDIEEALRGGFKPV